MGIVAFVLGDGCWVVRVVIVGCWIIGVVLIVILICLFIYFLVTVGGLYGVLPFVGVIDLLTLLLFSGV